MKKIVVLGAGLVGKAIAFDLCGEYDVTAVDIDEANVRKIDEYHTLRGIHADLSNPAKVKEVIADCDLVIGAVPGHMGFETLKTVIQFGKDIVDISFFSEDPFELDELARLNQVTAVVDFGVAPGMSNVILGNHNQHMSIDSFECMVGGLPVVRTWPWEYKAPFSPIDVIEEYTRPARIVQHGEVVVKPALTEPELIDFPEVGTLEAFNTDGLRSLLKTMTIPNMVEKTLRYPGHITLIRALRDSGFFDQAPLKVNHTEIRPVDFTTRLLFPKWELKPDEEEFTLMRIIITGHVNKKRQRIVYHLLDRYDEKSGISSMARTTGYPCTAAARLVIEGKFKQHGICPPEFVGAADHCYKAIMKHLEERDIHYSVEQSTIG